MFAKIMSILFFCMTSLMSFAQSANKKMTQPILGHRSAALITISGFQFKDLNRNGKLDKYEDWRLPYEERAKDLVSKMSMEEKVGLMLISTSRLKSERSAQLNVQSDNSVTPSSDLNEEDQVSNNNIFTRKPLPVPMMNAVGATKAITQFHLRHFIMRANVSAKLTAEWTNKIQALAESDGLGIPAIIASNPRNHITKDASIGLSWDDCIFYLAQ